MSQAAKNMANLQRQASIAQQQIKENTQQSFSQMNDATAISDQMSLATALGSVTSAGIGAATNGTSTTNVSDTLAGQEQAAAQNKFTAVRAQAPSLLPSQENVERANYYQTHKHKK